MKSRRDNRNVVDSKRWSTYAVAGAASAIGVATAEQANADSFYSGVLNQSMNATAASTFRYTPLYSNLAHNAVGIFANHFNTGTPKKGQDFFGAAGVAGFTSAPYRYAYNLHAGGQVLSGLHFDNSSYFHTMAFNGGYANSQFLTAGQAMVGFSFISPVEGTLHYGWARVNMGGAPANDMTLVDWAYSDQPGFKAGQVPEPASLGLLAVGAMGVATWRRQRRETAA